MKAQREKLCKRPIKSEANRIRQLLKLKRKDLTSELTTLETKSKTNN